MIGFLLLGTAIFSFLFIGYVLLMGDMVLLFLTLTIYSTVAIASLIIFAIFWEYIVPKPAKTITIGRWRAASYQAIVDDLGLIKIVPSKKIFPEGLIEHKYGFSFLPKPFVEKIGKTRFKLRRKSKNPKQKELEREKMEHNLAQEIALKKCVLEGTGKPFWLEYSGLAAAFNPYVLVPLEAKKDNPKASFEAFRNYLAETKKIGDNVKKELLKQLDELEKNMEHIRVVLDPRRFKEIHPRMYTRDHISAHRRINFERGRASVTGLPLGKILLVLVIGAVMIGAFFVLFYFMKQAPLGV